MKKTIFIKNANEINCNTKNNIEIYKIINKIQFSNKY